MRIILMEMMMIFTIIVMVYFIIFVSVVLFSNFIKQKKAR